MSKFNSIGTFDNSLLAFHFLEYKSGERLRYLYNNQIGAARVET
jgi:hypothetical protein